jgi:ABC-type branched-subunit amino acid transport system substrate-binding protein
VLTGCPWFQPPVVTVGAILPITGSAVEIGTQEKNAIELALTDLNDAKCLFRGLQFEVAYQDCESAEGQALSDFQALMDTEPDMLACLSSLSRISSLVVPEANTLGVPVLAVATSMPGITDNRPWAFRMHSTSAQEAQAMAQYWLDESNVRKVAFFYIDDAMGHGAHDTFVATFTAGGGEVV